MPLTPSEINTMKHAQPSTEGVLPVILERWSPRAFADRDVSPAELKIVFEAARWAPSSYNEQPWRFFLGHRNSETYKKIASLLVPFNKGWAEGAPVLILSVAKTRFSNNDSPNHYALHDLGAALRSHRDAGVCEARTLTRTARHVRRVDPAASPGGASWNGRGRGSRGRLPGLAGGRVHQRRMRSDRRRAGRRLSGRCPRHERLACPVE